MPRISNSDMARMMVINPLIGRWPMVYAREAFVWQRFRPVQKGIATVKTIVLQGRVLCVTLEPTTVPKGSLKMKSVKQVGEHFCTVYGTTYRLQKAMVSTVKRLRDGRRVIHWATEHFDLDNDGTGVHSTFVENFWYRYGCNVYDHESLETALVALGPDFPILPAPKREAMKQAFQILLKTLEKINDPHNIRERATHILRKRAVRIISDAVQLWLYSPDGPIGKRVIAQLVTDNV